jgi:hypothetical protein
MKIHNEDQLLDETYRAQVISEILGSKNVARKKEARRRYDIYKDKTPKYIRERLDNEGLQESTVNQMMNRCSNIPVCKTVVNKKARSYIGGVNRETEVESSNIQIQEYSKLVNFDQKQKKADRFRELYKNCSIQIVPEIDRIESERKGYDVFSTKHRVLSPWQYDCIVDANDCEKERVYILSDYSESTSGNINVPAEDGAPPQQIYGNREFIWWSNKYHFTTNEAGEIINTMSPEDLLNPIEMLNFVNVTDDQDNEFWAEGGDDLIDGSILVNLIITDMLAIAYQQGWGQFVITGKNVSLGQKVGVHSALVFNVEDKDDPQPNVSVVSANPPLDSWMRMVEQYVALLLTTNNLSPGSISIKLDASSFPSGIAMVIEKSEAINDINDTQEMFVDAERLEWEITKRWQNLYFDDDKLVDDYKEIGRFPDDMVVSTKFNQTKPVITEAEKLDNLKKRKDLGINEQVDLIMIDNPDLSVEQATEKLKRILEEKIANFNFSMSKENDVNEDKDDDNEG